MLTEPESATSTPVFASGARSTEGGVIISIVVHPHTGTRCKVNVFTRVHPWR